MVLAAPFEAGPPRRLVPAVDRAARLLAALRDAGQPCTLTDLAGRLGVNKATVLDILLTLRHHGLVEREAPTKRFLLGPALGSFAAGRGDWRQAARSALQALSARTGETSALGIERAGRLVFAECEVAGADFPLTVPVGRELSLSDTSLGKVLCAWRSEPAPMPATAEPATRPPTAAGDPAAFHRTLAAVRAQGYALDRGEYAAGVYGLAAPVWGPHGVVAGIAVVGLLPRLTDAYLALVGDAVCEAAA